MVTVEGIDPNPYSPANQFVVFSPLAGRRFQLTAADLVAAGTVAAPAPQTHADQCVHKYRPLPDGTMTCSKCGHRRAMMGVSASQATLAPAGAYYPPGAGQAPWGAAQGGAALMRAVRFPAIGWGFAECIVYAAFILGLLVIARLMIDNQGAAIAVSLIAFVTTIAAPVASAIYHGGGMQSLGFKMAGFAQGLTFVFVSGIGLFFLYFALAMASVRLLTPRTVDIPFSVESYFLLAVILAPICEETFFRGFFYPVLRNKMGQNLAMVVNGLVFAAFHLAPGWQFAFVSRTAAGIVFCYLYDRTDSLYSSIACHAMINLGVLMVAILL